jgi:hypothetical protein
MNTAINNTEFENMTNKWKQIFADFIELIVDDDGNTYETYRFKCTLLRNMNACPSIWTTLFLDNFSQNIQYDALDDDNEEYSIIFMKIVFNYFNEYQIEDMQIEPIKQYLKFLCVEAGKGEDFYADIDDNTDDMNNHDKTSFCNSLIVLTSLEFMRLHTKFIQDIFMNILTPAICLK